MGKIVEQKKIYFTKDIQMSNMLIIKYSIVIRKIKMKST